MNYYNIIMFLTSFHFITGQNITYGYLTTFLLSIGFKLVDAVFIISISSITNSLGRIIIAFMVQKHYFGAICWYSSCLVVGGAVIMTWAHFSNYAIMVVFSVSFGLVVGKWFVVDIKSSSRNGFMPANRKYELRIMNLHSKAMVTGSP